ncbi:hypothetical protein FB451DRAFT_1054038, partial [Mycena latifolia]
EASTSATLHMTFVGATEAHLLAPQIRAAGVIVILAPVRPYPASWGFRRMYSSGPPLSRKTAVTTLLQHGATLALGVQSEYAARFELAWAALDADGAIDYMPLTTNMHKALGLEGEDLVISQRGRLFDLESKVLGVLSGRRAVVDLY